MNQPMKSGVFDRVVTATMAIAAIAVAGTMVYRTFLTAPALADGLAQPARRLTLAQWDSVLAHSISTHGRPDAPVQIAVFSDLECPACARFHPVLEELTQRRADDVRLLFVHFPLRSHRFALPAARALECADDEGHAPTFISTVYREQDSLGLLSWETLASRAGIEDALRIERCATSTDTPSRVAAGANLAKQLRLHGTPTLFVNRWEFTNFTSAFLDSLVANMTAPAR